MTSVLDPKNAKRLSQLIEETMCKDDRHDFRPTEPNVHHSKAGVSSTFTSVRLVLDKDGDTQCETVRYLDDDGNSVTTIFQLDQFATFDITNIDGDDDIWTKDGNDTIHAGGGDNYIVTGADTITTGNGNNFIDVGADTDVDTVNAGFGNDHIAGVRIGDIVNAAGGSTL